MASKISAIESTLPTSTPPRGSGAPVCRLHATIQFPAWVRGNKAKTRPIDRPPCLACIAKICPTTGVFSLTSVTGESRKVVGALADMSASPTWPWNSFARERAETQTAWSQPSRMACGDGWGPGRCGHSTLRKITNERAPWFLFGERGQAEELQLQPSMRSSGPLPEEGRTAG